MFKENQLSSPTAGSQEKIFGVVTKLVFQNLETAFCIAQIKLLNKQKSEVTITGVLPGVAIGQKVTCSGAWTNHPKFGLQFTVSGFEFALPCGAKAIEKYLASGLIKGIGPALAKRLVEFFGDQTLEILDQTPDRVLLVPGIGKAKAESIIDAWTAQREISRIMLFLRGHDVPVWLAHKIYAQYQDQAIHKITTQPYALVEEMHGVGFKTADGLALKLGLALNAPKRLQSALLWALREAMQGGDLYVAKDNLMVKAVEMLTLPEDEAQLLQQNLTELLADQKVVAIERENLELICLPVAIGAERSIAANIKRLQEHETKLRLDPQEVFLQLTNELPKMGFAKDFELSELQKEAVLATLQHKVTVITGGPGTGKTTLLRALCGVLKNYHIQFLLAAPTGRAAKRISESARLPASTLHRLLEYDPSVGRFKRNPENCLEASFVIVDEASMIDVFLALGLLKALKNNCHLLFLGDVDQLPSVGPGNFLADLISSSQVKTVRLNNIFRQAADSAIVRSAHAVNQAQMPERGGMDQDFMMLSAQEPEQIQEQLTKIVHQVLPAKKIALSDWIVLSPMHKGPAGCQALNFYLQKLLNPNAGSESKVCHLGQDFFLGDRVMQLRNNYDKNVFNGDIGHIKALDAANKALSVTFFEREVLYKNIELEQLVLAYAISIHKSQGSEFAAVTIPLFAQHFVLLSRKLLYTAITRAKRLCMLLGQTRALAIAVKSQKSLQRVTLLSDFLNN